MKNCGLHKVDARVSTCLPARSLVSVGKRRGLDDLFTENQTRGKLVLTSRGIRRLLKALFIQAALQWASSIS
jgi:hypothetical protein